MQEKFGQPRNLSEEIRDEMIKKQAENLLKGSDTLKNALLKAGVEIKEEKFFDASTDTSIDYDNISVSERVILSKFENDLKSLSPEDSISEINFESLDTDTKENFIK